MELLFQGSHPPNLTISCWCGFGFLPPEEPSPEEVILSHFVSSKLCDSRPGLWTMAELYPKLISHVFQGDRRIFFIGLYRDQRLIVQPLCFDSHGPWNTRRPLVLLHQKIIKKGLIQVTLAGILFKPFVGSLLRDRCQRPDMNDRVYLLSAGLVQSVWEQNTSESAVGSWECCELLTRTCSGCQIVDKDSEEGDWVSSKGHQHFSFSITSTYLDSQRHHLSGKG